MSRAKRVPVRDDDGAIVEMRPGKVRAPRPRREQRRIDRRKRGRPSRTSLRRNERDHTAHGYELAMMANGAPLMDVVNRHCGSSDAGRMHADRWRLLLAEIPQRAHRRRVFEHYLRTFNGARPHGSQFRVVDAEGYVGKRYAMGWRDVVDANGKKRRVWGRCHVPSDRAGGLAQRQGTSPRSCDRYREIMRAGKLIDSAQPPRIDKTTGKPPADAWWPAGDDPAYPYGHLWLTRPPSHEMIRRWLATPPPEHPKRPALGKTAARHARSKRAPAADLDFADVPF
jgi:hypothetical protein